MTKKNKKKKCHKGEVKRGYAEEKGGVQKPNGEIPVQDPRFGSKGTAPKRGRAGRAEEPLQEKRAKI